MKSKTIRCAIQLFILILLGNTAVGEAEKIPYHHCYFDEIHKTNQQHHLVTEETNDDDNENMEEKASLTFDQLRVKFSAHDLKDDEKNSNKGYCKDTNSFVKDVHGVEMQCRQKDVLDAQKKRDLLKIVRTAIHMHTARLKVKKMQGPIKVPKLVGPLCKLFAVPDDHNTAGVSDADFVLYVSSRPSSKTNMFAAGAPCAAILNSRPVVGVLMYTTEHIQFTAYSVRVAAHEIAHALGFTYTIMKDKIDNHMKRADIRHKHSVEEIHTENVVKFVQKQYNCGEKWAIEIEDEKGALSVPSHSHWKRRNALEELMAPIVTAGYYTYLTLALFQDLGFYQANFSRAEEMEWGKDGGCNFIKYRCVGDNIDNSRYFCSDKDTQTLRCAPGRRGMGTCSGIYRNDQLPYAYRYFWRYNWWRAYYEYYAGGENLMTDRCPIYEAKEELSCENIERQFTQYDMEDLWCVRIKNLKAVKAGFGDRCVQISLTNGKMEAIVALEQNVFYSAECTKKGSKYFADLIIGDSHGFYYECPSPKRVIDHHEMKQLMKNANNQNTDDFNNMIAD